VPRTCTVCAHDEAHTINVALVHRESCRTISDRYDRRRYNAYCGVYRAEDGNLYERYLLWHPLLWWDVLRPGSLWRGMRLSALRSFYKHRKVFLFSEGEGEGR
jgi:hypothetical protein